MYIRKFTVRNYMNHRRTEVSLDPITALVGRNGAGKSALFDAMLNFSMLARGKIRTAFGPYPHSFSAKLCNGARNPKRIQFDVDFAEDRSSKEPYSYRISYSQRSGPSFGNAPEFEIADETLTQNDTILFSRSEPDYPLNEDLDNHIGGDAGVFAALRRTRDLSVNSRKLEPLARDISRITRFRLNPFALSSASLLPEVEDADDDVRQDVRLGYEGENLAGLLFNLSEKDEETFRLIETVLRREISGFDSFEFNTLGTNKIGFSIRYSDLRGLVSSPNVSHGTLTLIGLITLLNQPSRPPVMLIEEPENGLTPTACEAIYSQMKEAVNSDVDPCQIIFSSHSPFVICNLWNGDDRSFLRQVTSNDDGDASVISFTKWVEQSGAQLQMEDGERKRLGLPLAEQLMSGRGYGG